jgi:hypothetical protein
MKGGIEVKGRLGRRRRKLLDDLKERRGYSHLKEEALDRTIWKLLLAGFLHWRLGFFSRLFIATFVL